MGASPAKSRRSLYSHLAALLLLPAAVLWRQDNSLYTPPGWTDPWFYTGFANNLVEFKRYLFRDTYYGSRLAAILPGAAVYSIFGPLTAAAVWHLAVWAAATFSLFAALRRISGERSAFLTAILFGTHPWLWAATGWDYPDGAALAYFCIATALFTYAALDPPRKLLLFLAGIAAGAAIHSNLSWAGLAPLAVLTYAGMARAWHFRSVRRSAGEAVLWSGLGAVLLTGVLAIVNYRLDGNFWFFVPTLRQGRLIGSQPIRWLSGVWGSGGLNPALWLPVTAVLLAVAAWAARRAHGVRISVPNLTFFVQLCLALGWLGYSQRSEIHGLSYRYYTSALVPFAFLLIGSIFWEGVERLAVRDYVLLCAAALLLPAYLWSGAPVPDTFLGVVAAVVVLSMSLITPRSMLASLLALAGLFLLAVESRPTAGADAHENRRSYVRIMQERARLESVRRGRRIRFWFDERDPEIAAYTSLMSTYLMNWSFLGTSFPQLPCDSMTAPETGVVVLSSRPDTAEVAGRALSDCGRQAGLAVDLAMRDTIAGAHGTYSAAVFFAQSDPASWRALNLPVMPLDAWKPLRDASARATPDGLEVRTSADPYSFAAVSPRLVAPSTGLYRFTLKYQPQSGRFVFGLYSTGDYNWIAHDTAGVPRQPGDAISVAVRLQQGQPFGLVVANNNDYGRGAASFTMREVTAAIRAAGDPLAQAAK